MRRLAALMALVALAGCRATYPAPEGRTVASLSPSRWSRTDTGDLATIRRAEQTCLAGLSPRAVSAAFQAVDEVAEALTDSCSIQIVGDDPLVWHVWCGSDALFQSGHYLAPPDGQVACDGGTADTAFECIGRILGHYLLDRLMSQYVEGVQIVSVGSVDRQRLAPDSVFLQEPCPDLQSELSLADDARWSAPEEPPSDEERAGLWNGRLSWCRAAFSAQQLERGMQSRVDSHYELAAIGAGSDWLDQRGRCPTSARQSGERGRGQCRDARRVDLFIRVRAEQGTRAAEACQPPSDVPGGESGQALYCYADCQARAAVGRNPEGYQAPHSAPDLLFGQGRGEAPATWIVDWSEGQHPVNTASVRQLLLRSE